MISIAVFAQGSSTTLKQLSEVTVKGATKTTSNGMVSFDLPSPGTYNVVVKSAGYQTWQGDLIFGQYANLADVTLSPDVTAPPGYTGYCNITPEYLSMGTFFQVKHPDLGRIKGGYSQASTAEYYAHIDERCFSRVPPPATQEEIITRSVIGRVQGQIDLAITNALSPIQAAIGDIKAWITESIFELLMKKLDEGVKQLGGK